MNENRKFTPIIVVFHIILIVLAYTSPFWLDWKLILVGVVLNFIQILLAGGCVLSHAQFDDKDQTFHEWYLKKLGIRVNRRTFNYVLRYVIPFIILGVAILFQVVAHVHVLTSF